MTDVLLLHGHDGGDIIVTNGQAALDDTPYTATYLSLFGGNEDDSGVQQDDPKEWWGNKIETLESRKYRSQTQHVLRKLVATSGNIRFVEDAIRNDLAWMISTGVMKSVLPSVRITAPKRIDISIDLIALDGSEFPFRVPASWPGPQ